MKKATNVIGLVIKIMLLVILVMGGVFVYSTCSGQGCIQKIDKTMPDVSAAPLEVATDTHIYYATKATLNEDKSVTMSNWYEKLDDKWALHEKSITLPPVLHPRINKRA